MSFRVLTLTAACMAVLSITASQAQGLRPASRSASALPSVPAVQPEQRQADFIVAVVNVEPLTNHEVTIEIQRVVQQLAQQRRPQPDLRELSQLVLERMINERAQLQLARETGIRVDEPSIDQAEEMVARQNKMDVAELRRRMALDGLDPKRFRDQLRDQLMLTRLRERDVEPRVRISDLEVDQYLQEQKTASANPATTQIHLAQLLVAVPEDASEAQVATLQAKAQRALERARGGEDFTTLVRELSDARDRATGGQLGLRSADRYPPLFLEATQALGVGGISGLVRSGAGFHILKVIEKQSGGLPPMMVTQSRVRHILLRPNAQMSESMARDRLNDFRQRILSGQTGFASLAREHSQDSSSEQGGDLGWAYPGQFVPEFEEVINRLNPGQIGEPLISRFGVHLIQLLERRETALTEQQQREMVRGMLREKKLDENYTSWAREVRARAYVELREPPQ